MSMSDFLWLAAIVALCYSWIWNKLEWLRLRAQDSASLLEKVESLERTYEAFKRDFPFWEVNRTITITRLDELQNNLDTVCLQASYVKGFSNATRLTSSVWEKANISAFVPESVSQYVSYASMAGDIIEPVATAYDDTFTVKYIEELQTVFQEDADFSDKIRDYFVFTKRIDEGFKKVFECRLQEGSCEELIEKMDAEIKRMDNFAWWIEVVTFILKPISFCQRIRILSSGTLSRMKKILTFFQNQKFHQICRSSVEILDELWSSERFIEKVKIFVGLVPITLLYKLRYCMGPLAPSIGVLMNSTTDRKNTGNYIFSLYQIREAIQKGESQYSVGISMIKKQLQNELRIMKSNDLLQ